MEEEIEDEFYCGEPIEEKKRGFADEYKDLMRSLTDVGKQPDTHVFRQRPILGNRILTPVREDHHISDHDFVRLWQGHTSIIDLLNACNNLLHDMRRWTAEHTISEIIDRANDLRRKGVNLKEYVI
tara:strand:+ start:370 stop:747 length:378 start_codon:yes stop_codon:yes gene_type:complete